MPLTVYADGVLLTNFGEHSTLHVYKPGTGLDRMKVNPTTAPTGAEFVLLDKAQDPVKAYGFDAESAAGPTDSLYVRLTSKGEIPWPLNAARSPRERPATEQLQERRKKEYAIGELQFTVTDAGVDIDCQVAVVQHIPAIP